MPFGIGLIFLSARRKIFEANARRVFSCLQVRA